MSTTMTDEAHQNPHETSHHCEKIEKSVMTANVPGQEVADLDVAQSRRSGGSSIRPWRGSSLRWWTPSSHWSLQPSPSISGEHGGTWPDASGGRTHRRRSALGAKGAGIAATRFVVPFYASSGVTPSSRQSSLRNTAHPRRSPARRRRGRPLCPRSAVGRPLTAGDCVG